jgi:hypothetical protein
MRNERRTPSDLASLLGHQELLELPFEYNWQHELGSMQLEGYWTHESERRGSRVSCHGHGAANFQSQSAIDRFSQRDRRDRVTPHSESPYLSMSSAVSRRTLH